MQTADRCETAARFEQMMAFHCAPAMAGIKAADLFSWPGAVEEAQHLVACFSDDLTRSGICLRCLFSAPGRNLILIFRPARLEEQLNRDDVTQLLARDGYPVGQGLDAMLTHLERRVAQSGQFPHEVGLFLGYPAEDVEGFRKHNGRDFKFCGLWKVYSDVDQAQERFRRYHCCRRALCRRVQSGCPLAQVFRVA